jgi:hypothetical protein
MNLHNVCNQDINLNTKMYPFDILCQGDFSPSTSYNSELES